MSAPVGAKDKIVDSLAGTKGNIADSLAGAKDKLADSFSRAKDFRGCIDCSPIDEVITQTSLFERPLGNPSGWMYRPTESWVEGNIHTGYRKRTSTSYDSKGNAVAGMALLSGSLALDRSHEGSAAVPSPSIAPAPTGASADGWISTGSTTYDVFGNATGNRGPNGRCHRTRSDARSPAAVATLVSASSDAVEAVSSGASCSVVTLGTQPMTVVASMSRDIRMNRVGACLK